MKTGALVLLALFCAAPDARADLVFLASGRNLSVREIREEGDNLGWWGGSAFTFHLGQMVTRRLGLGIGIDMVGAAGEADGRKQVSSIIGLSIEGQLALYERLAVHAGVGIGAAQVQYEKLMPDEDSELRGTAGSYYLLGYRSTDQTQDGKLRAIEVRVNRPDVEVRARRGYIAPGGRTRPAGSRRLAPPRGLRYALAVRGSGPVRFGRPRDALRGG